MKKQNLKHLFLLALCAITLNVQAQSRPTHEQYVKIGSENVSWGDAYKAWSPGKAFYQGLDAEATENENFNISRIKPRKRFINANTQVRPSQDPERKLLWWCPIGEDGWNALPSFWFGGEVWTMWSYTDIWGNWTAPLMSMPAAMLDVCHKNGVQISCLALFEWYTTIYASDASGYGYLLNKILTDTGGSDKFLKFLKYYGIDGLGFNSEFNWSGTISSGPYSGNAFHTAMKKFLGDCYSNADSYGVPFHNCWYSLTSNEGSVGGGNALNSSNKDWFDYNGKKTSTAYFMNYGGSLSQSQNTVETYFPNRSSYDVFMGVDLQAGGSASWMSLPNYKISVGLWGAHNRNLIYETRGERGSDPLQQQKTYQMILENVFTGSTKNPVNPCEITNTTRFNSMSTNAYGWAQFITARSTLMDQDGGNLATDPFVTNFNLGNGLFFNVAGERNSDVEWYNIGMQDYMPTWRWWFTKTYMGREESQVSSDLHAEFTWDDAYFGGSCLQISGATDVTYAQLFKTEYAVASSGDYLTIRYKVVSGSGSLAWACSKKGTEATVVEKTIKAGATASDEWVTVQTQIAQRGGIDLRNSTIAQIGLKFTDTSEDFKILIGQISLTRGKVGSYNAPQAPAVEKTKMMARNYKGVDMKIIYNMNNAYTGATKEAYEPIYNNEVKTSYFRIYTQQEGMDAKVFTATTSWAAYVVGAPYDTEAGGKIRIGVAAVALDGEKESEIIWGDWIDPMSVNPTIVEGTVIDKPIIKAGEEFTLRYIDTNHAAATWEVINSQSGASVQTFANTTSITLSLATEGSYDVKITNADGSVAYTRGIIQVSPDASGAIPSIGSLSADKTQPTVDENITLSYTAARLGEGAVSRAVKVEDPNLLRFPEVVGSRPYTYMMWFKVDKYTHGMEGTNLIDKRSFSDVWPHNNWGDIWVTIRTERIARKETGASSTAEDYIHPANEISFNTYGWTEHDDPNSQMMSVNHSVNEGQWTHVAVTFGTDNKQKMYFNGKKVAETTIQHITSNGVRWQGCPVYVGGTSVYKGGFNGWVDEFQVWDRVLSDEEVLTAMKGFSEAPAGLQGYWTFENMVQNSEGSNVFPNLGQKGSSYQAALISTVGQKGENTSEVEETILNGSNDELGNPMISGSYQVTTSAEWTLPSATVVSKEGTTAKVAYAEEGAYPVTLTLANRWGTDTKTFNIDVVSSGFYKIYAISANETMGVASASETKLPQGTADRVTLTATPNPGYAFVNWTVNGEVVSTENPYTTTISENTEFVANFAAGYTATVLTNNEEWGSVNINGEEGVSVKSIVANGSVTFNAVPADGYEFVSWSLVMSGMEFPLGVTEPTYTVPQLTADMTIKATFKLIPVPVTGINLSQTEASLRIGKELQLSATILPNNATDKNIVWSSQNGGIATVDQTGKITAISAGTTTITVSAQDGSGVVSECEVTILPVLKGDSNDNDVVTVTDAVTTTNYIVGKDVLVFNYDAADVTSDGNITISDVSGTVTIVLEQPIEQISQYGRLMKNNIVQDYLLAEDFELTTDGIAQVDIAIDNTINYTALQADITAGEGITIEKIALGDRADATHKLQTSQLSTETTRVVIYSPVNKAFKNSGTSLMQLNIKGSSSATGDISINNIYASDALAQEYMLLAIGGVNLTPTSLNQAEMTQAIYSVAGGVIIKGFETSDVTIYTMTGLPIKSEKITSNQQYISLPEGMYIVNIANKVEKVIVRK